MSKVIWKFDLPLTDRAVVKMPQHAEVLTVQVQGGAPKVWAIVNPSQPTVSRVFLVVGTGGEVDPTWVRYVGTFQLHDGALVFHVFEE